MEMSVDKWYAAISLRHSRRQYDGRALSKDLVAELENFSYQLNGTVNGARVVVVTEKPDKVFKGAIGSYGKIKGASAYAAFLGNIKDPNVQEKVGYLGELFILEATARGLGTCWVGGFFKPEIVQTQIRLKDNEQVFAVTPIGFIEKSYTLEEKLMSGFAKSHKRKKLDKLYAVEVEPVEDLPTWMRSALEAARLAPSAVNRQPWRFSIENGTLKISMDNNRDSYHISKRLDCGIAMAHMEIGAKHDGVPGCWEYLGSPDVARFNPF